MQQQKVLQTVVFIASLHFIVPSIKISEAQDFTVVQALKQFDTIMEKQNFFTYPKLGMRWLYTYAKKLKISWQKKRLWEINKMGR